MKLPSYNGGKTGNGTYQTIINNIPPHKIYVAPFAGHDGIFQKIRRAEISVLNDIDPAVCDRWLTIGIDGCQVVQGKYQGSLFGDKPPLPIVIIKNCDYAGIIEKFSDTADCFIYCDPPYPYETRRSQNKLYLFDWPEKDQHEKFLETVLHCKCNVMVSSYENDLYNDYLKDWHRVTFKSMTRKGPREQIIYMNYPPPVVLHDHSYLGRNFREREKIKRKVVNLQNKLQRLSDKERIAIISTIVNDYQAETKTILAF